MHSKGPWTATFNGEPDDDIWDVYSSDGELLAVSVSKSDARLIAAAPEMLEALRTLKERRDRDAALCMDPTPCEEPDFSRMLNMTVAEVRIVEAAIAKAEGRKKKESNQ